MSIVARQSKGQQVIHDSEERGLVIKALCDGLGNCVQWDYKSALIARENNELVGLTPAMIRKSVIAFVREKGPAVVEQVAKKRPEWSDAFRFYYKVILPVHGFKHGLFVEMRLTSDEDPEFPEVTLVGAHPQKR